MLNLRKNYLQIRLIILCVFVFGILGCFSFKPAVINFKIDDPKPVKEKKAYHAWIKPIIPPKGSQFDNTHMQATYSFYKFVRELKQFEKVNILYSDKFSFPENSIVLEVQFSKMEEHLKYHYLYWPLSVVGMGISLARSNSILGLLWYGIFGGPSIVHKLDYQGNLIAYDSLGVERMRVPFNFQTEFNSNAYYYEQSIQANEKRKEMFEKAFRNLTEKWGDK